MTRYGTLRTWAVFMTVLGALSLVSASVGAVAWAIEVEGFWRTLGVILIGAPVALLLATWPIALSQMMRALADVGDATAERG
jgi:hypothetical protein